MAMCHPRFCLLPKAIVACCPVVLTTAPVPFAVGVGVAEGTCATQRHVSNGDISSPRKGLKERLNNCGISQSRSIFSFQRCTTRISTFPSRSPTAFLTRGLVNDACKDSDLARFDTLRYNLQRRCRFRNNFVSRRSCVRATSFHLQRRFCACQSRDSNSMSEPQQLPASEPEEFRKGGKYCVLLTGYATDYTEKHYGGYGKMFVTLLEDPEETWDIYAVIDGHFPSEEELEKYDGFVITGSASNAHGSEDWIAELCTVLQSLHRKKQRTLGVCFGHQVLSRALGGQTGKADVGWEIGLREVEGTSALGTKFYGQGLPSKFKILESHQDQVTTMPPGAMLLASSAKTGIEIFGIDDHILGIQGHPEFFEDVIADIIDRREALGVFEKEVAKEGRDTLKAGEADREILIQLCKRFLKRRTAD